LKLFGADVSEDRKKYGLSKKVACVLDVDPTSLRKADGKPRYKACWPFELGRSEEYSYKCCSGVVSALEKMKKGNNLKICYNGTGEGKTFEYELAFENEECKLVFPDSLTLKDDEELKKAVEACGWEEPNKKKALKAAYYLLQLDSKGENALELEQRLRANLSLKPEKRDNFVLPAYIKEAIEWVCSK
jgi:putative ATP-dependent endonuclease of OLD family